MMAALAIIVVVAALGQHFDDLFGDLPDHESEVTPADGVVLLSSPQGSRAGSELGVSVVRVVGRTEVPFEAGEQGSGFFVNERHILSNYHVVSSAAPGRASALYEELFVVFPGATTESAVDFIWGDGDLDLAVLRYSGGESHSFLTLSGDNETNPREPVYAVGYPSSAEVVREADSAAPTFTGGIVTRPPFAGSWFRGDGRRFRILQHDASIDEGGSGGPLVDMCDQVLGVNTARSGTHGFSAIYVAEVRQRLTELGVDFQVGHCDRRDTPRASAVVSTGPAGEEDRNAYVVGGDSAAGSVANTGATVSGPGDAAGGESREILVGADDRASSGRALQVLLRQFGDAVRPEVLAPHFEREAWRARVDDANSVSVQRLAQGLLDLEFGMTWETVYESWREDRDQWGGLVVRASTHREVAEALYWLERLTRWEAVSESWRQERPEWIGEIMRAAGN